MTTFHDAKTALMFAQPFFATLLLKLRHVEDATLQPPSLAVTPREIRYHPEFIARCTLDEAVFVLCHEVLHLAWGHLPRLEHYLTIGYGPDGKPLDRALFNAAMDYPINAALVESGVGTAPAWWPLCLDARFPSSMTPEEVYCLLREDQQNSKGDGQNSNPGQALDTHDPESGESDGASEGESAITAADILQAAQIHKALCGKAPAGMERLLETVRRPEVSPWRRLRQFIATNLPGHDATSWRRLQRRMIVRRIGVPARVTQGAGRIGVVVDTSGSIQSEVLQLFGGHLAAILSDAMPREVKVYWTDQVVHRVDSVRNVGQLQALLRQTVPGGGGTDMPAGVSAAEADACDAVVVLTDGYTPFCASTRPLLWAITQHHIHAPTGVTIHI